MVARFFTYPNFKNLRPEQRARQGQARYRRDRYLTAVFLGMVATDVTGTLLFKPSSEGQVKVGARV
jgi:hypothetical protein